MSDIWNDPRITEYVMGELSEQDREALEREIDGSPELAEAVSQAQQVTEAAEQALLSSMEEMLTDEQQHELSEAISGGEVEPSTGTKSSSMGRVKWILAIAASLTMVAGAAALWSGTPLTNGSLKQLGLALHSYHDSYVTYRADKYGVREGSAVVPVIDESQSMVASDLNVDFGEVKKWDVASGAVKTTEKRPESTTRAVQYESRYKDISGQQNSQQSVRFQESLARGLGDVNWTKGRAENAYGWWVQKSEEESREGMTHQGRGAGEAGDRYDPIVDNAFLRCLENPLSTFSIDVDTASYSKVRMYLNQQSVLPRPDAVRIEELVNYFDYDYEAPVAEGEDFAARMEVASCPWNGQHRLARVAIKGREVEAKKRPASNLVFLLDVSGSMDQPNKLPLVKRGMQMLLDQLGENDRVAIVVYAGAAGLVLDSTSANTRQVIYDSLERLSAGGSTNGGQGIALAYQVARDNFIAGGTNRVILCTDGDFNVGTTGTDELVRMVEAQAGGGVFLTVLGFGMGNHNDSMLEQISGRGDGNYAFIDTDSEAHKVLVQQISGTLVTIAKNVKIQVEFNPAQVQAYRLLGYENRILAKEDFNDDTKDAGEIGAGHCVTAFYELVPAGQDVPEAGGNVDDLKYLKQSRLSKEAQNGELLTLKLRHMKPDAQESTLQQFAIKDEGKSFDEASTDFQFAASVAGFGMLLRNSPYKGDATFAAMQEIAAASKGEDQWGLRAELVSMIETAAQLAGD